MVTDLRNYGRTGQIQYSPHLFQSGAITKIYNTNIDLVNDKVFTKFGLILSIRSQDIEQKPTSDINQGP